MMATATPPLGTELELEALGDGLDCGLPVSRGLTGAGGVPDVVVEVVENVVLDVEVWNVICELDDVVDIVVSPSADSKLLVGNDDCAVDVDIGSVTTTAVAEGVEVG